jgi:hypothetical protein
MLGVNSSLHSSFGTSLVAATIPSGSGAMPPAKSSLNGLLNASLVAAIQTPPLWVLLVAATSFPHFAPPKRPSTIS